MHLGSFELKPSRIRGGSLRPSYSWLKMLGELTSRGTRSASSKNCLCSFSAFARLCTTYRLRTASAVSLCRLMGETSVFFLRRCLEGFSRMYGPCAQRNKQKQTNRYSTQVESPTDRLCRQGRTRPVQRPGLKLGSNNKQANNKKGAPTQADTTTHRYTTEQEAGVAVQHSMSSSLGTLVSENYHPARLQNAFHSYRR